MTRLTEVAEELYGLMPDAFTTTRNERAKAARAEDRDLGDAVKTLPKPSTAAWVVNMLVRHQADLLTQVLDLGDALRQAQENLEGEQLRELTRQRRQLTAAVTSEARRLAYELGVKVSEAVAGQVEETLRAAMTDPGAAQAVRTGQLVEALSATGVGQVDVSTAVAVPEAIGMTARPVPRRRPRLAVVDRAGGAAEEPSVPARRGRAAGSQKGVAAGAGQVESEDSAEELRARALARAVEKAERAEAAAVEAEAAAEKAERKLDKARKRVAKLEARSLQLQGELEELRRKAAELEHELEAVDDELGPAEERRERAERTRTQARETAERARAAAMSAAAERDSN